MSLCLRVFKTILTTSDVVFFCSWARISAAWSGRRPLLECLNSSLDSSNTQKLKTSLLWLSAGEFLEMQRELWDVLFPLFLSIYISSRSPFFCLNTTAPSSVSLDKQKNRHVWLMSVFLPVSTQNSTSNVHVLCPPLQSIYISSGPRSFCSNSLLSDKLHEY